MKAPVFWQRHGVLPALLSPLGALYAAATARRVARAGWAAPVPVICCGNATVGGAGKTTLALDLGVRLAARALGVAFLTRGYASAVRAPVQVRPEDNAASVGDEALLLAAVAPTFVCPDRAAAARAAIAAGARVLVMDDGLQHPSLRKSFSFLVIDGVTGFGNGRVMPAGPLREPVMAAAARCQAAVLIGTDHSGALAEVPDRLPVMRATLQAVGAEPLAGCRVLAFAGIARPGKFFETLEQAGVVVGAKRCFPDHHPYARAEIRRLLDEAAALGAVAVTTPKDAVRLPPPLREQVPVIGVRLVWEQPDEIDAVLDGVVGRA